MKLNALERRAAAALALVVSLRMFGLFLILPVFAAQARAYPDAVPWLIGLALGVYGLGQALLQLPYGLLSDRVGRRPAISLGLLVFALGGLVAALATTLKGVVLGRALQGMGAVSGAGLALAADLSRDAVRGKVMAIIGASIGLAFVLALVAGAPLFALGGLPLLFALTAVLALASLALLWAVVPAPARSMPVAVSPGALRRALADPRLLLLDLSVFVLHVLLTAAFVALPTLLVDRLGLPLARHWQFYLPVMVVAAGCLPLFVGGRQAALEGLGRRQALALLLAAGGLALLAGGQGPMLLAVAGCAFFAGFTALEALLPTLVSRLAPEHGRGAALGAYSGLQFLGAFVGGLVGGVLLGRLGEAQVLAAAAALALGWTAVLWVLGRRLRGG
ncbi:MAG: MFS transporter [Xanthomonadales bacterium]|nr:MFS transporter [Xanthomonadales bacterium]